jgi:hypothetical protein
MSRDRLAASRVCHWHAFVHNYGLTLLQARRQQDGGARAHEMSNLGPQPLSNGHGTEGPSPFLVEASYYLAIFWIYVFWSFIQITSIQDNIEQIRINITEISALHSRTLNALDQGIEQDEAQPDQLAEETQTLSRDLKERIQALERAPVGHDAQMRKNRVWLDNFISFIFGWCHSAR